MGFPVINGFWRFRIDKTKLECTMCHTVIDVVDRLGIAEEALSIICASSLQDFIVAEELPSKMWLLKAADKALRDEGRIK